ncbi:bacteriocin [Pantoea coffeiphila]|uniref:Bacteriocin n=1 Tax=Pantoea coffeiphila TaxID=1465635 RepID=A0A2S9I9W7_9GAMM|nr:bacteriocin [Pantoea coffeiphila]MBM7345587.1 bacteriocin-like protein [Pantoea coffeiphila]PRD14589.1 hypothetical protein CQW29_15595 [Pantoea coffeiphila]
MSIRELNKSELSQISGGSISDSEIFGLRFERLLDVAKLYSQVDPKYRGMDCHVIAATEPGIRKAMITIIDSVGAGGQETVDQWLNGNW